MRNPFSDIRPGQERMEIARHPTWEEQVVRLERCLDQVIVRRGFCGYNFETSSASAQGLSPGPNPPKDRR